VSLETGQIVRTVDDVLYRYLGESSSGVNLTEEDFTVEDRWGELASVIDRSDLAVSFQEALNNKFYVVKPTRLDLPTMTVQNVGGLLLAQRAQILNWIANHSSNTEAVARYQIQLELLEATMRELGMIETYVDDGGTEFQVPREGLDVLIVHLPDIYVAPGSIFIEADEDGQADLLPLLGNQVRAGTGARIFVFNETPFSLTVNDAIIRDTRRVTVVDGEYTVLRPGLVYFNNQSLTPERDEPVKRISITQDSLGPGNDDDDYYDLGENRRILEAAPQDIYVLGDIVNEIGDVTLINNEGSIHVSGEIRGQNVNIQAAQDFHLNTQDWFHNMDPRKYPGLDDYREQVYNQPEA
jgi:hypothetical protein